MELNINSPAYFSDHYGIDDDVYRYCQRLYTFFKDRQYSDSLSIIGIIPVIAPKELYEAGQWKESVKLISGATCAIITIRLDFESYYNAESNGKIVLIRNAILTAVKKIKSRCKFEFGKFEKDLLSIPQTEN